MARISVKYPIGSDVRYLDKVDGKITAIFIRGKNRAYEFSYIDNNGNPASSTVEEVELKTPQNSALGFNRHKVRV